MICPFNRMPKRAKVYVVDARQADYSELLDGMTAQEMDVTFFRSACEALRTNPDDEPEMWVINMSLSDMSGTDLQSMLRARGSSSSMLLVGDTYSVEDEISARTSGASLYFAKPLQSEWLVSAGQHAA